MVINLKKTIIITLVICLIILTFILGASFYFKDEKAMFVGDFIFKESVGRSDCGDINELEESIEKIKKYDDDITLYPGHGEKTTLKYEKENNEFLQ